MDPWKIFTTLLLQKLRHSSYITFAAWHCKYTLGQLCNDPFSLTVYFSLSPATFRLQIPSLCCSEGSILFAWFWLHAGLVFCFCFYFLKSEDQITLGRWVAGNSGWKNLSREVYVNYILVNELKWEYLDEWGLKKKRNNVPHPQKITPEFRCTIWSSPQSLCVLIGRTRASVTQSECGKN